MQKTAIRRRVKLVNLQAWYGRNKVGLWLNTAHVPAGFILTVLYTFNRALFEKIILFPDSNYYILMAGGEQTVAYPFQGRILVPFLVRIVKTVFPMFDYPFIFFLLGFTLLPFINLLLFLIFEKYVPTKYALVGVWAHGLSFPVLRFFFGALTDGFGYFFLILAIYLIMTARQYADEAITITILLGLFCRETILIVLPFWLYSRWREENLFKRSVYAGFLCIFFIIWFDVFGYVNEVHIPNHLWGILNAILAFGPFLPFLPSWRHSITKEEIVYSLSVAALCVFAFFTAYFDARFVVMGYPLWIGISLVYLKKLVDWLNGNLELEIQGELEAMG